MESEESNETLSEWLPPELAERARVAAARDAQTAERIAAKKTKDRDKKNRKDREPPKPPEPRNPRFALAITLLGLALYLAREVATALAAPGRAAGVAALNYAAAACTALVYVKFLVGRRWHKPVLGALLALGLGCGVASALWSTALEPERSQRAIGYASAALALILSPMFWLLYGLLRRQSAERRAGLMQLVVLIISLLSLLLGGAARLMNLAQQKPAAAEPLITPERALNFFEGVALLFLLMNWPVLDRTILGEKKPDSPET
ncbi:MAG: hypothetical protein LBG83_03925 [Oscillospiraceae bacterium]|jgi:hypothetical protein|nr:hypothetical protein [Oscillospiraceae bacterium]